jgi:hypothetical protein
MPARFSPAAKTRIWNLPPVSCSTRFAIDFAAAVDRVEALSESSMRNASESSAAPVPARSTA